MTRLGAKRGMSNPVARPSGMRRSRFNREAGKLEDVEFPILRALLGCLASWEPPSAEEVVAQEVKGLGLGPADGRDWRSAEATEAHDGV